MNWWDIFVSPIIRYWTKSLYPNNCSSEYIISICVWKSILFGDVIDKGLNIITDMIELRHYFFKCLHFYSIMSDTDVVDILLIYIVWLNKCL